MSTHPILLDGHWIPSTSSKTFRAVNPATTEQLPDVYPVSPWAEVEKAIQASAAAFRTMRGWPGERFARFLERFADRIDARAEQFVETAHLETALPKTPRLKDGELPRTTNQLRQAAAAARSSSWTQPTIDSKANIRSMFGPIGPVAVFGPNNFPFAFNSAAGGDFAAAIAAGCPVIAKGHSSHPTTTRMFAEEALHAIRETEMPPALVQLIYRTSHEDGAKLVSHLLMGATGYTGGRHAGLFLKEAADKAGKPMYLELSSINPVYILPGAIEERGEAIVGEFSSSCLMGTGQFCTNPGLVVLLGGPATEKFIDQVAKKFRDSAVGTMLGEGVQKSFAEAVKTLTKAGATVVAGGQVGGGKGFSHQNTLLRVDGGQFLKNAEALQTEAFGNGSLFVVAHSVEQMVAIGEHFEGNLTGTIYSATTGADDALYDRVAPALRQCVGRLLNDKMPTGVAVSPAMNHGGPYPSTGHAGFTAVGIPAAIHRFGMLQCYDGVRPHRLPAALQNRNPGGVWRFVDGQWTTGDVG